MVRLLGSLMSTSASRKVFQVDKNMSSASEAIAGRARGTWMCSNAFQAPAPSMLAASVSSTGALMKWARIQKTAKGMLRPINGRMRPHRLPSSPSSFTCW